MKFRSALALLFLCILSIPALAGPSCENPIAALSATDAQTGTPIAISWSLDGPVVSLTLAGHDFEQPVVLAPNQSSYSYVATKPGEKHVTLTAVTDCGTFSVTRKYHVKQCNVVTPSLAVDRATVAPGGMIQASIDLLPGHTARWVVQNGTPSATTGASISVIAGASGAVSIDIFVARGNSCEVTTGTVIPIEQPCAIAEPQIFYQPEEPGPNGFVTAFIPSLGAGETASFAAQNATIVYSDAQFAAVEAPSSGSFTIDVTISNATCSRTFSRTFTVSPCAPAAVVSAQNGSCDGGTVVADFTGTAPFQGYWNDGVYFFTFENHLERTVTTAGTYTIDFFLDARCQGTVSGSAQVGPSIPLPAFTVDEIVGGFYYGRDTCPGLARTARLTAPIPAGLELIWGVTNATILSGQGTEVLQFAAIDPGHVELSAVFRNAEGCLSQTATVPFMISHGTPEISVSVEPSTIPAGGTAIVTFTRLNDYVRGFNVSSSLGDPIVPIGSSGERSSQYEYRSTSGTGVATITAFANNACGVSTTATTTLTIEGTVGARATVRALGSSCQDYAALAEFTGVAPFTGRWSNGQTFVTDSPFSIVAPTTGGTYTLVEFSDVNGPGTITGEATFDFVALPQPELTVDPASGCPNGIATATLTSPVPDGAAITWFVYGATILSGDGTPSIQLQLGEFGASINVRVTSPGACSPYGYAYIPVTSFVQEPLFDLFGVNAGSSTLFTVALDPNTASWAFENSLGDAMEIVAEFPGNQYLVRYTSSHGTGESVVRIYGTTHCGATFEASRVMQILPPLPTATLTWEPGPSCGAIATVTLTGAAPFTVTWSDTGEVVTTNDNVVTRLVPNSTYLFAIVADATGSAVWSNGEFIQVPALPYLGLSAPNEVCLGGTVTLNATDVPAGAEVIWSVEGSNVRIVSGQGTPQLVLEGVEPGSVFINASYRTAEGCLSAGTGALLNVLGPVAEPVITLPTSIAAGETIDITVAFDGYSYQSLAWETSNGDPLFNIGQEGMTFTLRYISQNGPGTTTIRAYGTTMCGQSVESTATLTITAP